VFLVNYGLTFGNMYDIGEILNTNFALRHSHPYKATQNFRNMQIRFFDMIMFQDTGNRYDIPLQTLNSFSRNKFFNLREVKLGKTSCRSEIFFLSFRKHSVRN